MRLIFLNIFILLANLGTLLIGAGSVVNEVIVVLYLVMLVFCCWKLGKEREYKRAKILEELAE